jgi:hypothetical protein
VLLLLLVGLASTACVSPGKPGVSMDNVEANVVFGIDKKPEAVLPANTDAGDIPAAAQQGGFSFAFRNPAADRLPPLVSDQTVTATCPSAPPTAAAEKPVDVTISGPVEEGTYVWKRVGTQTKPNPAGGDPIKTEIKGFEKRIIRNVQKVDDANDPDAYSFEMVQTLIDRPVIQVRTFLVKPHTSAQYQTGGVYAIDNPRVNEPEGGVSLIKVENLDENGSSLGTFEPVTGLLYLGLPVDASESFRTSATDPKTGQTIVQDSAVKGHSRIDACGDLVDGWRVESTQTRSDAGGSVAYNYLIATQYGGVPILEEIHTTGADGTAFDVTFSLGQLHPDPAS